MELGMHFLDVIRSVVAERRLSEDVIIGSIESALVLAYKKYRETKSDQKVTLEPKVRIDRQTGTLRIYDQKKVVDTPYTYDDEIYIEEAQKLYPGVTLDEIVEVPVDEDPENFGRIAAQNARQVISQSLKNAERELISSQYKEKVGELVTGTVFKSENDQVLVRLNDHNEAVLAPAERISGEEYPVGAVMKFYLHDVRTGNRGPRIAVSRTHPGLLRKLMELEIPEIQSGQIEIKAIAREAGARAKVAVYTEDPSIDPVGACVGANGTRVRPISEELHNEKIDLIIWNEDPLEFVKNALSPAKVIRAEAADGEERTAKVYAPADQLSLAIGKAGQNVRLAARLTGWKVDINTAEESAAEAEEKKCSSEADEA